MLTKRLGAEAARRLRSCISLVVVVMLVVFAAAQTNPVTGQSYIYIEPQKDFVKNLNNRGLAILANGQLSSTQKEHEFRKLYDEYFDAEAISKCIATDAWREMRAAKSTAQQPKLNSAVADYISKRLIIGLARFTDATVEVPRWEAYEGKIEVLSVVHSPRHKQYLNIKWVLRQKGTTLKVTDVYVEGFSLCTNERADLAQEIRGFVGTAYDATIAVLLKKIAKLAAMKQEASR